MALSQTVWFACLAILSCVSESPAPAAKKPEEPLRAGKEASSLRIKKEHFRYAGKSFAYWRLRLLTELEPKERLLAFRALKEFARHGYAAECAAAFLETARWSQRIRAIVEGQDQIGWYLSMPSFDLDNQLDNENLVSACLEATLALGDPAVPMFRKALQDDSRSIRLCAVASLGLMEGKGREAALPELLEISKGQDVVLRLWALAAVGRIGVKDKEVGSVLLDALAAGNNKEDRLAVLGVLADPDSKLVKTAEPAVLKALTDLATGGNKEDRLAALKALGNLDSKQVKTAERAVLKAVADPDEAVRCSAYCFLECLGTECEGMTAALLARLKQLPADAGRKVFMSPTYDELAHIVATLRAIGPKAKSAVSVLVELAKNADEEHQKQIEQALKKIRE